MRSTISFRKAYEAAELGVRRRVHLYYDLAKAVRDSDTLYSEIEKTESEPLEATEPPDRMLRCDKYFSINRAKTYDSASDASTGFRLQWAIKL